MEPTFVGGSAVGVAIEGVWADKLDKITGELEKGIVKVVLPKLASPLVISTLEIGEGKGDEVAEDIGSNETGGSGLVTTKADEDKISFGTWAFV